MDSKVCVFCNSEKIIDNFHNKYKECKVCKIKRCLKRYYENKDKTSNQQKIYYEKNRYTLVQKQNDRYINVEELCRSYVELQNRLKAYEKNLSINGSEKHQTIYR